MRVTRLDDVTYCMARFYGEKDSSSIDLMSNPRMVLKATGNPRMPVAFVPVGSPSMEEILEDLAVLHYEQNVLGRVLDECVSNSGFGRCQTAGGKRFRGFDQRGRVAPWIQRRTRPNKAPPVTMPST